MKIAIVGPGAVGSYYGAMLWRDRHEVHFLLRSDYETVRRHGVQIKSPQGDFHAQPRAARLSEEIGPCDLVLISLKTTANHLFPKLLPPLVSKQTAVMTLQNGLGNEDQLAAIFPSEQILGGLCFVCLNRTAPGVIEHLAHGKIVMGEHNRWPEPRTHDIASAFRHAGIPCSVAENLTCAHWEKLVWNIPFNGLGVASCAGVEALAGGAIEKRGPCLTTDQLLAHPIWLEWVRGLMHEIIRAARAKLFKVDEELAEEQIAKTKIMAAYKPSTLVDFQRQQLLELQSLFLDPLRQAQAAGVPTPKLARLCEILTALEQQNSPPQA